MFPDYLCDANGKFKALKDHSTLPRDLVPSLGDLSQLLLRTSDCRATFRPAGRTAPVTGRILARICTLIIDFFWTVINRLGTDSKYNPCFPVGSVAKLCTQASI